MPMRNRRVRLLLLAVILTITFFVYSRSDPATIDQAKQYAQRRYQQALTIGKQKGSKPPTDQSDSVNAALDAKKDEPFRVDFGAYSKAAGLLAEETTAAAMPPPAAAMPIPPESKEPKEPKEPKEKEQKPTVVEPKKEDPMRVDFEHYSKAAMAGIETSAAVAGLDPLNNPVIANPNPIVGVVGAKDDPKPRGTKSDDKPAAKQKPALIQQSDKGLDDEIGEGRVEIDVSTTTTGEPVHWTKVVEKHPITSTNPFPYVSGKPIPKIQFDFKAKPGSGGADEDKLAAIKAATQHSWKGYRDQAMGHDEVKPVSGKYANPFNAWGATLVDALDTLWMMGMKDEFEEALKYVEKIDFSTSRRGDIPVFETTIRYMGGLLGAYELSGRYYKVLLDKAAQLGEILYDAFDTPNRMPMTYYKWKPSSGDNAHRASRKTIMAELGSLSLEFTRLGQLVAEPKYYDAISRITHALGEWQDNTRIPGLWPTILDASGCARTSRDDSDSDSKSSGSKSSKSEAKSSKNDQSAANAGSKSDSKSDSSNKQSTGNKGGSVLDTGITSGSLSGKDSGTGKLAESINALSGGAIAAKDTIAKGADAVKNVVRRAVDSIGFSKDDVADIRPISFDGAEKSSGGKTGSSSGDKETTRQSSNKAGSGSCTPQGLTDTDPTASNVYTLGAAADSTYEYLPKMHLMLGGRSDEYRKMYVKAADAATKHLIYRAMIPDETREVYFAGNVDTKPKASNPKSIEFDFSPIATHLTCFVGGMFGMAGKIFDRPQDVEMAKKLTDGCIWAYNVTATGIMPEIMGLVKCDSLNSCKWDKVAYYKELDPLAETRSAPSKDISKPRDPAAPPPVGMSDGKGALQKRQYGGGEAQYGFQTAPAILPPSAATIVAEVPPLGMGVAGMPNSPPSKDREEPLIKLPTDGSPAQQLSPAQDSKGDTGKLVADASTPEAAAKEKEKSPAKAPAIVEKDTPAAKPKANQQDPLSGDIPALPATSHEQFVKKKIEDENLPAGFVGMYDRKYELRPEAIESVFYMYRITGEQYWRDRGWEMWNAVYKQTWAQHGATAIDDVSKPSPVPKDREESFWLAETLKYFYLLFDDPDRVSLDDWVLNTEAHFLTRLGA